MKNSNDEEYFILSTDYFTSGHLFEGCLGEKVVNASIRTKLKLIDGWMVKHNTFGKQYRYACGEGSDIKIFFENRLQAEIEVKNLKEQKKPYGTDFIKKHVLPRFQNGQHVKILVLTYSSLLTRLGKQLLKQHKIQLITTEDRLDFTYFTKPHKLYVLGYQIQQAVQNNSEFNRTPDYTSTSLLDYTNTVPNTVNNNNKQHDTIIETANKLDLTEQQLKPEFNYAEWLLMEAIRYSQWTQSLREHGIRVEN